MQTMLGVIRNLILDFFLFFVTAYMRKYPTHVTQCRVQYKTHYTSLEEASKKYFMTKNLQQ